jgi:hypothetical protein
VVGEVTAVSLCVVPFFFSLASLCSVLVLPFDLESMSGGP